MTAPELPVDGNLAGDLAKYDGRPGGAVRRTSATPKPSVGRIVHYRSYGTPNGEYLPECRAAVITGVDPASGGRVGSGGDEIDPGPGVVVHLAVLNPTGMFFNTHVVQDEHDKAGGTWHWPERTD